MKILFSAFILILMGTLSIAQTNPRPISMEEYLKAKTFVVNDLDNDTYVKFENTFVLDRYEAKKPIFITGDDGKKKRIDLYKFIAKEGMQELGLMVYYTNEAGKKYQALVPNFTADGKVWEKYFEDIHAIEKNEANFILKLSYVLSRELAYQQYKNINGGKEVKDEHATYGNDICFPGNQMVTLKSGDHKFLKDVKPGDELLTINPNTTAPEIIKVNSLTIHDAKNYAITEITLLQEEVLHDQLFINTKIVKATPNHPMKTLNGDKKIGELKVGDEVFCWDAAATQLKKYGVFQVREITEGQQQVYNIEAANGTTLILNGVLVKQK